MNQMPFHREHCELTRRYFLQLGVVGAVAGTALQNAATAFAQEPSKPAQNPDTAGAQPDPYFTLSDDFRDVSRGKPIPHTLSDEQKRNVGLTRETWKLEVFSDPDHPAKLKRSLTAADSFAGQWLTATATRIDGAFPTTTTSTMGGSPVGVPAVKLAKIGRYRWSAAVCELEVSSPMTNTSALLVALISA